MVNGKGEVGRRREEKRREVEVGRKEV